MEGADTATETRQTVVILIYRLNSHNLTNLLLGNVAYDKLNLTISLCRKKFSTFFFILKTYGK